MARYKTNYERETKQLIKKITDIQDEECQDFKTCYNFAISNFKFHRFLSVDSHQVNQSIEKLCEKLTIHSQVKKSKDLKELTEKVLGMPLFEHKNFGHTDTHYAILSLLINLAHNPTSQGDFESKKVTIPDEDEGFDWTSYLMEDMDIYRGGPYPADSPEWSESDGSDDETNDKPIEIVDTNLNNMKMTDPTQHETQSTHQPLLNDQHVMTSMEPKGYLWLQQNVIAPYWNDANQKIPESQEYYNIVKDWDIYEAQINPLKSVAPRTVVTEAQVIRETLWMLQGISELFVYERAGIVYHLKDKVHLSHLTQLALKESLKEFMTAGSLVWELETFIESVITAECEFAEGEEMNEPSMPLTLHAFAHSISYFLNEYKAVLIDIEKDLQKQEVSHTILQLKSQLRPWLKKLSLVHSVYMNGVYKFLTLQTNNEKAARLLSCLFDMVMELKLICDKELLCVLMPIWIETSRPYIDIIDNWITNGRLVDTRNEFIIQRNKTELVPDETFWKHSLMVKFSESQSTKSILGEEEEEEVAGEEAIQTDAFNADTAYSTLECTPQFLQAIVEPVIQAGKSMDVFNTLNCLCNILASRNLQHERKPLYEAFLQSLDKFKDNVASEVNNNESDVLSCTTHHLNDPIYQMLSDQPDPLLQINMDSLFVKPMRKKKWQDHHNVRKIIEEYLDDWHSIEPIDCLLENCLYPHIVNKSTWVCQELVNTLITDHSLLDYLQAMRVYLVELYLTLESTQNFKRNSLDTPGDDKRLQLKHYENDIQDENSNPKNPNNTNNQSSSKKFRNNFFLMEAGDVMFNFYTNIFSQLRFSTGPLKNLFILNQALTEAVEMDYPEEINKLRVCVEHTHGLDNSSPSFQLSDTDCMKLSYTIPWPVDIVLDSKSVKKYNQIFNMLIRIKRAKYCLDQLRFNELEKPLLKDQLQEWKVEEVPRKQKIHRIHILRVRLLFFVNTLNSHIMTRILTCDDLMSEIKSAVDLNEVIAYHDRYLEKILERCFLGKKNSALRDSLNQVLNITLQLNTQWNRGVDDISLETLSRMEEHFRKWIPFFRWCFNTKISAGQYPHLDQLISSLALSNEQPASSS